VVCCLNSHGPSRNTAIAAILLCCCTGAVLVHGASGWREHSHTAQLPHGTRPGRRKKTIICTPGQDSQGSKYTDQGSSARCPICTRCAAGYILYFYAYLQSYAAGAAPGWLCYHSGGF
jgi:hypothetical protein